MSARNESQGHHELELRLTVVIESLLGSAEPAPEGDEFEVWLEPGAGARRTLVAVGASPMEAMSAASRWAHGFALAVAEGLRSMEESGKGGGL